MPKEHIVQAYDAELGNLEKMIVEMGERARLQLDQSITSLVEHDVALARTVVADDIFIDQLELEVATRATQIFALRQPVADDLRSIVAALKISSDLERIGDHAKNISKRTITLTKMPLVSEFGNSLRRIHALVDNMIHDVLEAYRGRDAKKALAVLAQDTEVDKIYTSLFREILTYMMEDPKNITALTHLLFIAKNIERIGDHATNIAEQVYYVKTGHYIERDREKADQAISIIIE
ncbi:MAG: phosphate transport system regulatory protein PhoU [Alphaproteobacteria bacterium]|nr:MAG: phosphate transport system regulatory protein PhoU [Alphaproteobacteria bacterium]